MWSVVCHSTHLCTFNDLETSSRSDRFASNSINIRFACTWYYYFVCLSFIFAIIQTDSKVQDCANYKDWTSLTFIHFIDFPKKNKSIFLIDSFALELVLLKKITWISVHMAKFKTLQIGMSSNRVHRQRRINMCICMLEMHRHWRWPLKWIRCFHFYICNGNLTQGISTIIIVITSFHSSNVLANGMKWENEKKVLKWDFTGWRYTGDIDKPHYKQNMIQ